LPYRKTLTSDNNNNNSSVLGMINLPDKFLEQSDLLPLGSSINMNDWDNNLGDINSFYPPPPTKFRRISSFLQSNHSNHNMLRKSSHSMLELPAPAPTTATCDQKIKPSSSLTKLTPDDTINLQERSSAGSGCLAIDIRDFEAYPSDQVESSSSSVEVDLLETCGDNACVLNTDVIQYLNKPLPRLCWNSAKNAKNSTVAVISHRTGYSSSSTKSSDEEFSYFDTTTGRHCFLGIIFILIYIIYVSSVYRLLLSCCYIVIIASCCIMMKWDGGSSATYGVKARCRTSRSVDQASPTTSSS
jgi:hypothetical protein